MVLKSNDTTILHNWDTELMDCWLGSTLSFCCICILYFVFLHLRTLKLWPVGGCDLILLRYSTLVQCLSSPLQINTLPYHLQIKTCFCMSGQKRNNPDQIKQDKKRQITKSKWRKKLNWRESLVHHQGSVRYHHFWKLSISFKDNSEEA